MDAERDGGLGYFDGDTYVFRRNSRPIDGEEDAWLDGTADDDVDDDDGGGGGGGGGLDSTPVWRPRPPRATTTDDEAGRRKEKTKYVNDDDAPEDLGRRLTTLLTNDDETVMMALARHAARIREMRAKEGKAGGRRNRSSRIVGKRKRGGAPSSSERREVDVDGDGGRGGKYEPDDDGDAVVAATTRSKAEIERARGTVEELTELADALLFGGETEAYELTRKDWIHRFKLDASFSTSDSGIDQDSRAKRGGRGYFDDPASVDDGADKELADVNGPSPPERERTEGVMWEYRGNEDGVIHGPYTSRQMLDWTSCGYFVGESSVDIRRVRNSTNNGKKEEEYVKADVDDLMADLLDDDDDGGDGGTTKKDTFDKSADTNAESLWMRSDRVDFSLYL